MCGIIKNVAQAIVQFMCSIFADNKAIQLEIGLHKPIMKCVADIFRNPENFGIQCLCFASLPEWPLSAMTGLLNCSYWRMQLACVPISLMCLLYVFSGACMAIPDDF